MTPPPAPRGIDLLWTREHVPLGRYLDSAGDEYEVIGYALQATEGQRHRPLVLYRSSRFSWTNARETQDFMAFQTSSDGAVRPRFVFVGPARRLSWWRKLYLLLAKGRGSSRS